MINGKIKEWHMDPALLQKLATGGSVNIDSLMKDYIKKTDIITEDQLDPDILIEIDNQVARVQSLLDNYRLKADTISLQDIDTEFASLLENLQNHTDSGSATFDTDEIEAYINDTINSKLAAEVESAVSNVVGDAVDAAIVEKFDEAFNGEAGSVIDAKIDDAVTGALSDTTLFNDVKQDVLNSVSELYATQERAENIESDITAIREEQGVQDTELADHSERITALEHTVTEECRKVNDTITEDDLDSSIMMQLNRIDNFQNELNYKQNRLVGNQGQIIIFDANGTPDAADLIIRIDVAETPEELETIQNTFVSTVYDLSTLSECSINRKDWNYNEIKVSEDVSSSSYVDANLTDENFVTDNTTVTIENGIVSAVNESLIDNGTASFGFYGTRIKLYTTITVPKDTEEPALPGETPGETSGETSGETPGETPGEASGEASGETSGETPGETPEETPEETSGETPKEKIEITKEYVVLIDGKLRYEIGISTSESIEHTCFLCVENLSEGLHRVDIQVLPGETVAFNATVAIDDTHAMLAPAEDIRPLSFYEGNLYDTGDYVTEPAYDEVKSENVSPITVDDYDVEALDFDELEKRLIYSPATKKLYYCYNKTFILLSVDQQNRLDDIERRLAALEGA